MCLDNGLWFKCENRNSSHHLGICESFCREVTHNHPGGIKGAMATAVLSFCVVITLEGLLREIMGNQSMTILQSVKDGLRVILSRNTATISKL